MSLIGIFAIVATGVLCFLAGRKYHGKGAGRLPAPIAPPLVSTPSARDFEGQVAIITGGGSGLGRAMALNLARRGAKVVIASRKMETLAPALAEIEALGGQALAIPTDVRDVAAVDAMVKQTMEKFGRVDILVNNAAGNFLLPAENLTPNGWKAVTGIVLDGTWFCSSALGAVMRKQGHGKILNIVANYADKGCPGVVHSAAAKNGVLSLTRTLAVEWGPLGIHVNAFAPGAMITENASKNLMYNTPEAQEKIRSKVPLRRLTSAEEMAQTAIFLLTPDADYVNGAFMVADGGEGLSRGFMEYTQ
jgi:NAD(P)-dependent dehydrogenase (short-subunit alcohol dehydrogenase family)